VIGKIARIAGEYRSWDARNLELEMIAEMASNITEGVVFGLVVGKNSWRPSRWAKTSAPGITRPSATTKLANFVASASRTPEFARPCW
jgi:hypothetical protein